MRHHELAIAFGRNDLAGDLLGVEFLRQRLAFCRDVGRFPDMNAGRSASLSGKRDHCYKGQNDSHSDLIRIRSLSRTSIRRTSYLFRPSSLTSLFRCDSSPLPPSPPISVTSGLLTTN